MADSPESYFKSRPTISTNPRLQYPTLPPLSASVEEWLSRSRPSDMTSHGQRELPMSLAESWATLSVSDAHSEDGAPSERTDMGSLIDPSGLDDVASLDGRYTNSEAEGQEHEDEGEEDEESDEIGEDSASDEGGGSVCQDLPPLFFNTKYPVGDSILTGEPSFHQSTGSIEFIEPEEWPEAEHVELKHTVKVFEAEESSALRERLPYNLDDSVLVATVQQTVTRHSLNLDKPFHVLYVGSPEFRNIILDKIGDVLVSSDSRDFESSSAESSRYHVVPTSYGAGAVPNFAELLPIHVQLVVDECINADCDSKAEKPFAINLDFKNRPPCISSWVEPDYSIFSSAEWSSPDLAILFISSKDDTAAVKTRKLARAFMDRHGVPVMVISERPPWKMTSELIPVNHNSLHLCIESRNPLTGVSVVPRRYPIDISTFERITPNQLNRNLASLVSICSKKLSKSTAAPMRPRVPERKWFFDMEKYPINMFPFSSRHVRKFNPTLRLFTLAVISAIAMSLVLSLLKVTILFLSQHVTERDVPYLTPSTLNGPSSVYLFEGLKRSSASAAADSTQTLIHQLDSQPTAELLMGLQAVNEQDKTRFEVRVLGDCYVIIKPPLDSVTRGKRPRFDVQLRRYDETLLYEMSKLFEGVYTLRIDKEDAYGLVNVTISTGRPPFMQTVELDFGTPWTRMANWKRRGRIMSTEFTRHMSTAQIRASKAYDQLHTGLQVRMKDIATKPRSLWSSGDQILRNVSQIPQTVRETILNRSKRPLELAQQVGLLRLEVASSALQACREKVSQEVKGLARDIWRRLTAGAQAQAVDLKTTLSTAWSVQRKELLDVTKRRARSLLGLERYERRRCHTESDGGG